VRIIVFIAAALALLAPAAWTQEPTQETLGPAAEFRAAWVAFTQPAVQPQPGSQLAAQQQARLAALSHMEAAVAADPHNVDYRAAMTYLYLAAGKYQKAADAVEQAIRRAPDSPLLHLLQAQARATLAHTDPETVGDRIGRALQSFDRAAALDPENALALVQAASVAFDAGRDDIGSQALERALERPRMALYRLPVAVPLDDDPLRSLQMWRYAQYTQWNEMLARIHKVARFALADGREKQTAGYTDGAEARYRQVLALGRLVGATQPNIFLTLNAGIDIMEQAYLHLAGLAEQTGSSELERWKGEWGVLQIGRTVLMGALQTYTDREKKGPPKSIEEALAREAEAVRYSLLGVGLTPAPEEGEAAETLEPASGEGEPEEMPEPAPEEGQVDAAPEPAAAQ
jgi:tetratricopeptide (TPR) repeat protein